MTDALIVVGVLVLVVAIFASVIVGILWASGWRGPKKLAEFASFAQHRGWTYHKDAKGYSDRFLGAPFKAQMSSRTVSQTARDLFVGGYRNRQICVFEFKRVSRGGARHAGERRTEYFRVFAVRTPAPRPTLEVTKAGFARKVFDAVGVADLPVGHQEFDKTFRVTTDHEQFARHVLAPSVAEWLLRDERAHRLPFRFERDELVTWQRGRTKLDTIEPTLDYLCDVLDRVSPAVWR